MHESSVLVEPAAATKGIAKRLRRFCGGALTLGIIRLFRMTTKAVFHDQAHWQKAEAMSPSKSFVIALWHEHLLAGVLAHGYRNIGMLVARSFLGDCIAFAVERAGYSTFRGSTKKGGKAALLEFYHRQTQGVRIAITVEGSRGPRHEVKPGAIVVAMKTGIPILPMTTIAKRMWVLNTWDRFRFPLPFSTNHVFYGEPYLVPAHLSDEDFLLALEELKAKLIDLDHRAFHVLNLI